MSAAGLARVNVTQRKLLSDQEAKLESSVMTTRGTDLVVLKDSQKWRRSGAPDLGFSCAGGPSTAMTPGDTRRGFLKPSGNDKSAGNCVANSRIGEPAAAM